MKIKDQTIKSIADDLDMGMLCFYHKITGEVEVYPDEMSNPGFDDELWRDVMRKVKKDKKNYIALEKMRSFESFKVMETFIETIDHIPTRGKFIEAIERKKPFSQFNNLLNYYPDLLERWYKFKSASYVNYVKRQLGITEDEVDDQAIDRITMVKFKVEIPDSAVQILIDFIEQNGGRILSGD